MAALVLAFFGAAGIWTDIIWARIAFGLAVALGVGYCVWDALDVLTHQTTFLKDEVIVSSFRGDRRFARADLFAWNWGQKRAGMQEVELYREGVNTPFRVQVALPADARLQEWFGDVTSLEWRGRSAALDEVEADAAFGDTREKRLRNAVQEGRVAAWIGLAILAPAAWAFFYPTPYHYAVGATIAAPVLLSLLTVLRHNRWKFERSMHDPRPATGWVVFMCAMVLMARALLDWQIIDWLRLAAISLVAGGAVAATLRMLLRESSSDRLSIVAWATSGALFCYGALTPLNMWLDRAPPETHRAVILEEWTESVRIGAWGPFDAPQSHSANAWLLDRVEEGGPICADLYRGAFGIRSFDLKPCPD
jgi:hypothetical protein